jgi:hypothetical protein
MINATTNIPSYKYLKQVELMQELLTETFKDAWRDIDSSFTIDILSTRDLDVDTYGECDVLTKEEREDKKIEIRLDELLLANCLEYMFAGYLGHELEHARQVATGELVAHPTENAFIWKGEKISLDYLEYKFRPWEVLAFEAQEKAIDFLAKKKQKNMQKELASA